MSPGSGVATVPLVTLDKAMARRLARAGKAADDARTARDNLIRQAAANGATLREIAAAVNLSFAGVKKILDRDR
jgi:hypothetical protein